MSISRSVCVMALALLLTATTVCQAITLSLSSPDDLLNLTVGQNVTIDVNLVLDNPMQELNSLAAGVEFDGLLVSSPTIDTAGGIIPDPGSAIPSIDSTTIPGKVLAGVSYLNANPSDAGGRINSDGVFYRVTLQTSATGSGTFALNPLAASALDEMTFPFFVGAGLDLGDPLPFTITRPTGGGEIPEPTTAVLAFLSIVAFSVKATRRGIDRC